MKYFPGVLSGSGMIFILVLNSAISNAQTPSTYDKNGNLKSISERRYEESRNNQNKYTPKRTPEVRQTATKPASDAIILSNEAPVKYGKYDLIGKEETDGLRAAKLNNYWGYIDRYDKEVIALKYESVGYAGYGLYGVKLQGKWGFVDKKGIMQINCQFDNVISGFNNVGTATILLPNNRPASINKDGKLTSEVDKRYYYVGEYRQLYEGLACVKLTDKEGDDKYGFVDGNDKEVIPLIYGGASNFDGGLAVVKSGLWGCINKDGLEIIPFLYHKSFYFNKGGLAHVESYSTGQGFIDRTGKVVIPLIYQESGYAFSEGSIQMKLNGRWGFVDSISGQMIVHFSYDKVSSFANGMALVMKEGDQGKEKYGFVNKSGKEVIPVIYKKLSNRISEGSISAWQEEGSGVIDKAGNVLIPLTYQDIGNAFSEGYISIKKGDHWGVIDHSGKTIVPFKYDKIEPFSEGVAAVKLKEKWGVVDNAGKLIISAKYDAIRECENGLMSAQTGTRWGCISKNGEEIIPPLYDVFFSFKNEEARVVVNGKRLYIDKQNNVIATVTDTYPKEIRVNKSPLELLTAQKPLTRKVYKTVKIGKYEWTTENLNESFFRNGDPIYEATTAREWEIALQQHNAAWCYYDNDPANGKKYGKLYNWYAVTDQRGLAPEGMHIPSEAEWRKLTNSLDGKHYEAGGKMKSNEGWIGDYPYPQTNERGFAGFPAGIREYSGDFTNISRQGFWWAATEYSPLNAVRISLIAKKTSVDYGVSAMGSGLSIRCVRD